MKNLDFLDFIERTNKASDNDELYSIFKEALLSIGYDQITYSIITDHISHGLKSRYGIVKECPSDWFNHYFDSGYQHIDPRIRFGSVYKKTFIWNRIEDLVDLSKNEKLVLHELDSMGFHNGIAVPIFGVTGELAAVTASRSCKDADPDCNTLSMLQAIVNQFHLCYLAINEDKQLSIGFSWNLTPREKEILQWCGYGKSNWDISKILSISESGVEYHLKNIHKKMGVNNRISAVMKAIKYGCIKL
ncbi:MAG: LuxR family transcriptional regulator [Candidatus Thiodiazotropha sp.]